MSYNITVNNYVKYPWFPAFRERESHTQHLKSIEAELDAQVARVENVARERARADYEEEKRALQDKMECEMAKMDAELKIFKTVPRTTVWNKNASWLHSSFPV